MLTCVKLVSLRIVDYFCKNQRHIMNKRLEQFLKAENISQSQFADSIGVARASVSHILAGRNKPGFDFLVSMSRQYPALNLEWLITGKGKMFSGAQARHCSMMTRIQLFRLPNLVCRRILKPQKLHKRSRNLKPAL